MRLFIAIVLSGCALQRLEEGIASRQSSPLPIESSFVHSYCRWLERCSASEESREKCWMMPVPDACRRELASACMGEVDQMSCNDGLSIRCEPCFGDALPP